MLVLVKLPHVLDPPSVDENDPLHLLPEPSINHMRSSKPFSGFELSEVDATLINKLFRFLLSIKLSYRLYQIILFCFFFLSRYFIDITSMMVMIMILIATFLEKERKELLSFLFRHYFYDCGNNVNNKTFYV